ncbi:tetratricopeptide repeat protein [Halobacteriovorax marinus]|uniref:tetratricopeptide repeat protein n=1 Tax=Halobacteriovorax marinus TaxID=97084 RepID=UPI003A959D67
MKILTVISLLLLASCGSHKIVSKLDNNDDAFSNESFMRFGHTRLTQVNENEFLKKELSNCYRGSFSTSLKSLQDKLGEYKSNEKYWLYIGICYQLYGSQLKANFYYDYALSGSKYTQAAILNNKALVAMKARNFDDAYPLLEKSIKLAPTSNVPKYNLAQLYIKFNHLEKARSLITPLVRKNQGDVDLILSMMTIEIASKDYKRASYWAGKFNSKQLTREDISLYVALLYYELGNYAQAKEIIGKQRATIIDEIATASRELNKKIDIELERIKEEKDSKDANIKKGVNRVAVKN